MQSRAHAIEALLELMIEQPLIVCNGFASREAYQVADRPHHFYMIGSMGVAAAIGLGVALAKPEKRVVVFDGDGNVLMGMGTLATVGALQPKNFVHVVFDNEVYGSTGNQPTLSRVVQLEQVARATGYVHVARVREREDLVHAFKTMLAQDGPSFLLVKVTECSEDVGRVMIEPLDMTQRFKHAIE